MNLQNKTALVTGANRGIGRATVTALLAQNVARVYATARNVDTLPDFGDDRVVALELDVNDPASIASAARTASDVQILVNNAGVMKFGSLLDMPVDDIQADFATNFYGTLAVVRHFVPVLERNSNGAIVNVASMAAFVNFPGFGGYSASKAALFSLSQAIRTELAPRGISVHTVNPGPIDTDMTRDIPFEKASVTDTANGIVQGLINDDADIFPDAGSQQMIGIWRQGYRDLEQVVYDMHHAA